MAENTKRSSDAVATAYDFSRVRRVADIAGGNGELLSAILRRHPKARGTLFELEHVVSSARGRLAPDVAARCELVAGDMFTASLPAGADVYVLKHIIHDWDDSRSHTLLANCRKSMTSTTKLLVVEDLVCGPNQNCRAKVSDIVMMVRNGGRNRTEQEYRALLKRAAFSVERIIPLPGGLSILESVPTRA